MLPKAASHISAIDAEDRAVNETETASVLKVLKACRGGNTEKIGNCDPCCENIQVSLSTYHRWSGDDVNGWLHLGFLATGTNT